MVDTLRFRHWRDVRPEQWSLKFFDPKEVADSRDGSIVLHVPFGLRMDGLREFCGFPIRVTSWYRTPEHDRDIGGKGNHSGGWAADIAPASGKEDHWYILLTQAAEMRFAGIGVNKPSFIHLDDNHHYRRQGLRPRVWQYD
jgi:zinc D-Ala-D-Ala carboxypeptidase